MDPETQIAAVPGKLTCHLHVGMPKTGTTSIQESLSQMDLGPVRYLPFRESNHSTRFAILFEATPWNHRSSRLAGLDRAAALRRKARFERELTAMLDDAAGDPAVTGVIFSGERMGQPGKVDAAAMERLKAFFGRWSATFRVYGYARPLASMLPSHFQQRLKTAAPGRLDFDSLYPDYRERLEKFDLVFGREAVSLRLFDRRALEEGDVVHDIAGQIGVQVDPAKLRRENDTLSAAATALIFVMRRGGHLMPQTMEDARRNQEVFSLLRRIDGPNLAFDPVEVSRLADRNAEDMRWIEDRIGASMGDCPPPPAGRIVVRHERDLLDLAAAALPRLRALPVPDADGVSPRHLAQFCADGLAAA